MFENHSVVRLVRRSARSSDWIVEANGRPDCLDVGESAERQVGGEAVN